MATRSRAGATRRRATEEPATGQPRTGARRTVIYYIKQLPQYLRLLGGLISDPRVALVDKLLVAGAMAYIVMPIDLVPDFIPFSRVSPSSATVFRARRCVRTAYGSTRWCRAQDLPPGPDVRLRPAPPHVRRDVHP